MFSYKTILTNLWYKWKAALITQCINKFLKEAFCFTVPDLLIIYLDPLLDAGYNTPETYKKEEYNPNLTEQNVINVGSSILPHSPCI